MPQLRTLAAATALAAASVSLVSVAGPSEAKTTSTPYAMRALGYGTRVSGGDLAVNSSDTGYQSTGCTRKAGKNKTNSAVGANLANGGIGFGKVGVTKTHTWTTKSGSTVASHATHSVGAITLFKTATSALSIKAINSSVKAYHSKSGFHATGSTSIGSISLQVGSREVNFPIPSPGRSVTIGATGIPGVGDILGNLGLPTELTDPLAVITVGKVSKSTSKHRASAVANGISISIPRTHTKIKVAHTRATIDDGSPAAVFTGYADAIDASALGGIVQVGRTPLRNTLCAGTNGKTRTKAVASLPLGKVLQGLVDVSGLSASEDSDQSATKAHGHTVAKVASVQLGGGQIVVQGLKAQANAKWRKGHGYTVNKKGTSFAKVRIAGRDVPVSQLGTALNKVDIPGLAKIQTGYVVKKTKTGIEVVALRLTLLDATDQSKTIVNIGHAKFGIHRHA